VINRPVVRDGKPYPPANLAEFELLPGVEEACARLKGAGCFSSWLPISPTWVAARRKREEVEAMHRRDVRALPIDRRGGLLRPGAGVPSDFRKPARECCSARRGNWRSIWAQLDGRRPLARHRLRAAAGCRTIFMDYGYDEKLRAKPDFTTRSLSQAADIILQRGPN